MGRPRVPWPKWTPEIMAYLVTGRNKPRSIRELAKALNLSYSQVRHVIDLGIPARRFTAVETGTHGKKYISNLMTKREIEEQFNVVIDSVVTADNAVMITVSEDGGTLIPRVLGASNVQIGTSTFMRWIEEFADKPGLTNKFRQRASLLPQALAEYAHLVSDLHTTSVTNSATLARLEDLYTRLGQDIIGIERALELIKQFRDNPLYWSYPFVKRMIFEILDIPVDPVILGKMADCIDTNYGVLNGSNTDPG